MSEEVPPCSFCGGDPEEALAVVTGPGVAICDACVNDCIAQLVAEGVVPDLAPLQEEAFLYKPGYLTENDIRSDLSLFEFDSLEEEDDDAREQLIEQLVDEIAAALGQDELLNMLAEAVRYRQFELKWRVLEKNGLAEQARFTPEAIDAMFGEKRVPDARAKPSAAPPYQPPNPRFEGVVRPNGYPVAKFRYRLGSGPDMLDEVLMDRDSVAACVKNARERGYEAGEHERALEALDEAIKKWAEGPWEGPEG